MIFKRKLNFINHYKGLILFIIGLVITFELLIFHGYDDEKQKEEIINITKRHYNFMPKKKINLKEELWNNRNFSQEDIRKMSILGRRLFLYENVGVRQQKTFVIYVYKFGQRLENRLIKHYSSKKSDPFEKCSVKNCLITYDHTNFKMADAVLFHLHLLPGPPTTLKRTNFNQRWVWMSDEGIFNSIMVAKDKDLDHYNNLFNWSMTYRTDSDVPVPYGRTIPLLNKPNLDVNNLDIFSRKNKTVAIMGSSCTNKNGRWKYVEMLKKYIEVDAFGKCGTLKCPGHYGSDCPLLNDYKFYLAFENCNCKDYITEKAWWNAFEKEAVPVVMGTTKSNYEKLFPPNSFIHVKDFQSPKQLADYLTFLSNNRDEYNKYHAWRSHFKVVNEHGYFQSNIFHYCRLCEALNYNSPLHKTYESMKAFWNVTRDCNNNNFANIL